MKFEIKLLSEHPEFVPFLSETWHTIKVEMDEPEYDIPQKQVLLGKRASNTNEMPMTFVAVIDNKPVGMCNLEYRADIRPPEIYPCIAGLWVLKEYRRYNIGRAIVDRSIEMAKSLGLMQLYLVAADHTLPAWYNTFGFSSIDTLTFKGREYFLMHKALIELA